MSGRNLDVKVPEVPESESGGLTFPISGIDAAGSQVANTSLSGGAGTYSHQKFPPYSQRDRAYGIAILTIAVILIVLSELFIESEKALYETNLRYYLTAGQIVSIILIGIVVYLHPGNYESLTYLYVIFFLLVFFLTVSHRIGYGLALFSSFLLILVTIGILWVSVNPLVMIVLTLSIVWFIWLYRYGDRELRTPDV